MPVRRCQKYIISENITALTGLNGEVSKSEEDDAGDKLRAGDWENNQLLLSENATPHDVLVLMDMVNNEIYGVEPHPAGMGWNWISQVHFSFLRQVNEERKIEAKEIDLVWMSVLFPNPENP